MLVTAIGTNLTNSKSLNLNKMNLNIQDQTTIKDKASFKAQPNGWFQLWDMIKEQPLFAIPVGVGLLACFLAPFGIASFLSGASGHRRR